LQIATKFQNSVEAIIMLTKKHTLLHVKICH